MSDTNFAAIGQLVTEARNLLDSIKGGSIRAMETAFEALKQQFNDKLSSTATELTSFVNQQKANVNGIFSEPDKRYQVLSNQVKTVVVGGSHDKWYPVVIGGISHFGNTLQISRSVHMDSTRFGPWNGSLSLVINARTTGSQNYRGAAHVDEYTVHGKGYGGADAQRVLPDADVPFVGRISSSVMYTGFVIWLRGETTYYLSSDNGQVSATVYDDGAPVMESGKVRSDIVPMNASDGVHASVPAIGYVRGE
ncbi:hypothetical protein [Vibrio alginolyticus]|uniref:hypothetical protein n=1 Tax=Vibrio alginolyticus TaxID=663 RepID=UPI0037546DAB